MSNLVVESFRLEAVDGNEFGTYWYPAFSSSASVLVLSDWGSEFRVV